MIADAMGWRLDRITDEVRPKVADAPVTSQYLTVEPGTVAGIIQDGVGFRKGQPLVTLHMEAYLGAPESFDAVQIIGIPPLSMKLAGGIHGDIATAAIVINSIPKVLETPPGLRTMRDMVLPSFAG
jgi:4-hydroxy-tetrahydrodipicolinate reductase